MSTPKKKGEMPLNPHHTHFLLVDDGCDRERNIAEFRAKLVEKVLKVR